MVCRHHCILWLLLIVQHGWLDFSLNFRRFDFCRYTIPYLLKCPFFKLDGGIKVDLVPQSEYKPDRPGLVKLQLHLGDPKLRKDKHKDNEAIQFDFDMVKDNPEKISKELVGTG